MLKVVAINSSKRKKNTHKLICCVEDILKQNDIEVEIINLYDYDIKDCIGCEHCILKGKCVLNDSVEQILNKIKCSDGVILTSPVYLQGISGKLKTLIDRTCSWFHRPEIYGKPVLVIATTKGSGLKSTINYMQKVVTQWGGINAGSIGRTIRNIDVDVKVEECKLFIKYLKIDKKNYKPSMESLMNYQVQKALAQHLIGLDEEYWRNKGWNEALYYFECKINPVKKLIANSTFKMIRRGMGRNI